MPFAVTNSMIITRPAKYLCRPWLCCTDVPDQVTNACFTICNKVPSSLVWYIPHKFCFQQKVLESFLLLHENICCQYPELIRSTCWNTINKYPKHMFLWRNKKKYLCLLSRVLTKKKQKQKKPRCLKRILHKTKSLNGKKLTLYNPIRKYMSRKMEKKNLTSTRSSNQGHHFTTRNFQTEVFQHILKQAQCQNQHFLISKQWQKWHSTVYITHHFI